MSKTETQSEALRLAALLQCGADDPMWILHCEMLKKTVGDAAAELRRLDAENKALRADAERYRWLRDEGRFNDFRVEQKTNGWMKTHSRATLDAAIDAALAAQAAAKTGDAA